MGWGYSDISAGSDVVVTNDDTGRTIAIGQLEDGVESSSGCEFYFGIPDVPNATNYGVTVSHRGTLTYSKSDLESDGWNVQLTLGDD